MPFIALLWLKAKVKKYLCDYFYISSTVKYSALKESVRNEHGHVARPRHLQGRPQGLPLAPLESQDRVLVLAGLGLPANQQDVVAVGEGHRVFQLEGQVGTWKYFITFLC